jgi:uncharacterized membrane protein
VSGAALARELPAVARLTAARILLGAAIAGFGAGFAGLATVRHDAYWSGRFDLGNLTQAVWSTAHGHVLEMTDLQGHQISRLGAHFDPIVVGLAPIWRVWPSPTMLLVVQAVAVALGALPVFLLAHKHLGSEWAGLAFALVYLLYAPTEWLVVDDFHPVALATPLLLAGFWFLDEDRLVAFCVVGGLACLTKEHIGFAVAAMGLWYALARRRPIGLVVAGVGVAVSLVAIAVVVPHYAPGGGSPFQSRYDAVGGSPSGIVRTALTDPGTTLGALTETRDLGYLFHLLLPLAFLSLLAPGVALTAAPEIVLNLLSDVRTQTSIHFHYTAAAVPGLLVAAIFGTARLRGRNQQVGPLLRGLVAVGLVATVVYGPVPLWKHVPFGQSVGSAQYHVTARNHAADAAVALVPAAAAVSATNTMGAHLSARRSIYSFPLLEGARWVVVDTLRMSYADDNLDRTRGLRALRRLRRDPRWRVVFARKGILVLHRTGAAA